MAKYTNEQIKKAKAHFKYGIDCDIFSEPVLTYAKIALDALDALDLINRKEAEIERLKEKNRLACQCTPKAIRRARAEAIKEFADRLKEKASPYPYYQYGLIDAVSVEDIANLVKMVGEQ